MPNSRLAYLWWSEQELQSIVVCNDETMVIEVQDAKGQWHLQSITPETALIVAAVLKGGAERIIKQREKLGG